MNEDPECNVSGPYSAETVFVRTPSRPGFDAVVACYHDQGMISVKCLSFGPGSKRDAWVAIYPNVGGSWDGN